MTGNFENKTIKILALENFKSEHFLRRLQNTTIGIELAIIVTTRTHIFLSVSDRSIREKNNAQEKMDLVKNILDGCEYEDSEYPHIEDMDALVHVVGTPVVIDKRMDELVSKFLDLGIKSCIFVNLEPIQSPNMDCPFKTSFSVAVAGSSLEIQRNLATAVSLIRALYDYNSIYVVRDRRPKRSIKKLLMGEQIYSSLLDLKHASAYFQLPLTYGIEEIRKMNLKPPEKPFSGVIVLGELAEHKIGEIDYVKLESENLYSHMAVWGATGVGKTTFLKNMLLELLKTGIRWIIMDWHNEYRNIATDQFGRLRNDTIILNPFLGTLSLNPLELFETNTPRHIQVWERIENFISLMKQMFILGEIQEARLRQSLASLYAGTDTPNISDAIIMMSERKMKTLTMKLDKFTKDFYGQIFNRRKSSLPFSQLRRMNVIIELGQLPTEVRMFFACVFLILWWDNLKTSDSSPNVLVLDDFYRYANLEVIREMLSEARKFNQGLICSHQGPYQLPEGIREEVVRNTASKVVFRQEQTWDKYIVRDALGGFTKEQIERLSYLKRGWAIAKIPSRDSPDVIIAPPPPENKYLLDSEIKRSMKNLIGEPAPCEEQKSEEPLEKRFLDELYKKPDAPLTEIIKAIRIKTSRGYQLKNRLVVEGFLVEEKVNNGIGRPKIVYRLTGKGLEYLDKEEIKNAPQYGKPEHVIIKDRIASVLRGWKIEIEKGCDVRAESGDLKIAIEVETGKSHDKKQILRNIKRDAAWANKIVIVCTNQEAKTKIVDMLQVKAQDVVVTTYSQIDNLPEILKL